MQNRKRVPRKVDRTLRCVENIPNMSHSRTPVETDRNRTCEKWREAASAPQFPVFMPLNLCASAYQHNAFHIFGQELIFSARLPRFSREACFHISSSACSLGLNNDLQTVFFSCWSLFRGNFLPSRGNELVFKFPHSENEL